MILAQKAVQSEEEHNGAYSAQTRQTGQIETCKLLLFHILTKDIKNLYIGCGSEKMASCFDRKANVKRVLGKRFGFIYNQE